jgi:hypothetical protein
MQGEVWPEIKGLRPFTPRYVQCTCGTCGQQFRKRATEVAKGEGKFCTRDCYNRRPKTTFQIQY